ncbi:hypothetical protein VNO77_18933 [Canavalia gladiata]|uniref:Uncharacterized protein n=1 Tax=Canavalia gladiata TaxID=3824 RepID=A0AAN9QK28_CANGL
MHACFSSTSEANRITVMHACFSSTSEAERAFRHACQRIHHEPCNKHLSGGVAENEKQELLQEIESALAPLLPKRTPAQRRWQLTTNFWKLTRLEDHDYTCDNGLAPA